MQRFCGPTFLGTKRYCKVKVALTPAVWQLRSVYLRPNRNR